jgi:hypothetical protein
MPGTSTVALQDPNKVSALLGHTDPGTSGTTQRIVAGLDGGMTVTGLHGVPLVTAVTIANGTATALPAITLSRRKAWIAYNSGTTSVWIGGAGITASNTGGIPVGTSDFSPAIDLGTAVIYGIAASNGGTLTVLEVS